MSRNWLSRYRNPRGTRFDLNVLSFSGSNAVAIAPKSRVNSCLALSIGRRGLSTRMDASGFSPHTSKREPSAEASLATGNKRSMTGFGNVSSVAGAVSAAMRLPLTTIPSVYDCSWCRTIVGMASFQSTFVPCPNASDDNVAPLNGKPTDLKKAIHGSRVVLGTIAIVVVISFRLFFCGSCPKSQ